MSPPCLTPAPSPPSCKQAGCPFTIVDFTYVYPEDLDVDVLCESLSRLITDLPVLGGRVSGYMRVRLTHG